MFRGLYICHHILEEHVFVFTDFLRKFCPYVWLVFKSGLSLRAGYDNCLYGDNSFVQIPRTQSASACVILRILLYSTNCSVA